MALSVIHTTETVSGKEYPLTVTRETGAREIEADGTPVRVTALTVFESPLGRSRCCTMARPEPSPEERAAVRRRIQEAAAQAMIDQGLW